MPVEALWHWLRADATRHHCHAAADDLTRRVAAFEASVNADPYPSPIDSGPRATLIPTRRSRASQTRRGLGTVNVIAVPPPSHECRSCR